MAGRAPAGPEMGRRRLRQRRLHRAGGRAMRASCGPGHRSVRGAARLCADAAGGARREFRQGDAMALPFPTRSMPRSWRSSFSSFPIRPRAWPKWCAWSGRKAWWPPTRGRCWGGGFLMSRSWPRCAAMGITPPRPPQVEISRMQALQDLWRGAGLEAVETREITVQRSFR